MCLEEMAAEYRKNMMQMEKRVEELEAMLPMACATRKHKLRIRINILRGIIFENMQTILYLEDYHKNTENKHQKCG